MMIELADRIVIGFASPGGQTEKLLQQTDKPVSTIMETQTENFSAQKKFDNF